MFCIHCGRPLPEDGTPCVCQSAATPAADLIPPTPTAVEPEVPAAPEAPVYTVPAEPVYTAPTEPVYTAPTEPVYTAPTEPVYTAPAEPVYTAPAEPVYTAPTEPVYTAPTEPVYTAPTEPVYTAPTEPVYTAPTEPVYTAPAEPQYQQPQYQQPQYQPYQQPQYQPYQQPQYQQPVYAYPQYAQPVYAAAPEAPAAKQMLKSLMASPLFLIAIICTSVQLVLTFISALIPSPEAQQLDAMFGSLTGEYGSLTQTSTSSNIIGTIITMIPAALIVAGLWMVYVNGISKSEEIKTGGFTLLRVMTIIMLVCVCILVGVGLIVCLFMMAMWGDMMYYLGDQMGYFLSEFGYYGDAGALLGELDAMFSVMPYVLLAVLAVAGFLSIFMEVKVLRSLSSARAVIAGTPKQKASMFVVVMLLLGALYTFVDMFGLIMLGDFMGVLVALLGTASAVLFAVCILQYNKKLKAIAPYVK